LSVVAVGFDTSLALPGNDNEDEEEEEESCIRNFNRTTLDTLLELIMYVHGPVSDIKSWSFYRY